MKIKKTFFSETVLNAWVCAHFFKNCQYFTVFLAENIKSYNYKENTIRVNIKIREK